MGPYVHLPEELLRLVACFTGVERDISSLARTCIYYYSSLNAFLYQHNSLQRGSSALLWAAKWGMEKTARISIENNADADSKDSNGETPLLAAARHGHIAVAKLLLEPGRVDADSKGPHGETPLLAAARYGHEAVVKLLLETGRVDVQPKDDPTGWTPLYVAAWHGYEAVVKLLLATDGVDADPKDSNGWTPLLRAAQEGHEAVVECVLETGPVVVQPEEGVHGWTPLSVATQNGHRAVVELLQWSEWRSFWNRAG